MGLTSDFVYLQWDSKWWFGSLTYWKFHLKYRGCNVFWDSDTIKPSDLNLLFPVLINFKVLVLR